MDVAQAALQAAYAMPVKDPCDGCHGIKEAAILAALQRIRLCEAAAEVLDKLAQRLQAVLDRYSQPHPGNSPLSASCRAEALARDADRNHPDEVLRFALYPRLKANVADRRTLGLGIHVMRRAPH
jgi:hypothetical protein